MIRISWKILLIYFIFLNQVLSIYRPYDVYRPSASSLAEGGTGVANPNNISGIIHNPAYAVSMTGSGISFALDAQTRISNLTAAFSLQPQYIPLLNFGLYVNKNSAITVGLHSPFQRIFPDTFFLAYCFEIGYAHTLMRYLNIGVTAGAMMGIEARSFIGWGFSGSLGLLSNNKYIDLGLFFRLSSIITYPIFSQGFPVTESTPHILRFGASKYFNMIRITFELEYLFWKNTSFQESSLETAPPFEPNFLGFLHPHLGFSFKLLRWSGIKLKTGFFTEDYFDEFGNNQRQILWSVGFEGIAYNNFWRDRLKINFVYVSSSLFSLFWSENNQIEKFQVSFNYYFKQ